MILTEHMSPEKKGQYVKLISEYSDTIKDFLRELCSTFEDELFSIGIQDKMLRKDIHSILSPLVKESEKGNIGAFIIYSNNSSLYNLEYAGDRISKLFDIPYLFSEYVSRNDTRRIHDGPPSGYRKKTLATLQHILPGLVEEKVLFMDDNPHPDLLEKNITYIQVEPYTSPLKYKDSENIWSIFEKTFNICLEKYKLEEDDFFNLYHVKNYLRVKNLLDMKNKYLSYTNSLLSDVISPFIEDETITSQIDSYIKKISPSEGGRRKRTRRLRRIRKTIKRRK
jgi:hypothetical protein